MDFKIRSDFKPTGDQPKAINQLTNGVESNEKYQTLLGNFVFDSIIWKKLLELRI
jgi:excinuclease UvrABC helicase subunit UvrB